MKEKNRHKRNVAVLVILQFFVLITIVSQVISGNYYNVFLCVLTLILFNLPSFFDKKFNVRLSAFLEGVILFFIFASAILGEIQSFYTIVPHWDAFLHLLNGFIMAAIGFLMIDVLNSHPGVHMDMSPYFVAFTAFCFSMTIGVIWEFFEFFMDAVMKCDMQKDFIVTSFSSVRINPTGLNNPIKVENIIKTIICCSGGEEYVIYGYLDIGVIDTIKDLMVNLIGAAVFSIIGMFYIKRRGKGKIAESFIPEIK